MNYNLIKYPRAKNPTNVVSVICQNKYKKITKDMLKKFVKFYYPEKEILKYRVLRSYNKGCIGLITAKGAQPLWK